MRKLAVIGLSIASLLSLINLYYWAVMGEIGNMIGGCLLAAAAITMTVFTARKG